MKLFFISLGCRLNQAEVESLAQRAATMGHTLVADATEADWAVINTCTVTHVAARKSRQATRRLRRDNPDVRITVIGCYAEMSPEVVGDLAGVDLIVPNADKEQTLDRLFDLVDQEPPERFTSPPPPLPGKRTRAFVKIQDGCDNRCSYCIVTVARGPSRSRPPAQILAEVQAQVDQGTREVVLTGVNIGAYGRDRREGGPLPPSAGWSLARLVREILQETSITRLRLSSVEPWDVTDQLLTAWDNPRLCRQLHLPLQSGSDSVLKAMGRRSTTEEHARLVHCLRERVPDVSLSTDLIVGFPGESEADFEETMAAARALAFSRLHVFRYSKRQGTPAAKHPEQVPPQTAQERSKALIRLGNTLALAYHRRFVDKTVNVLFETPVTVAGVDGWSGLTDNYLRVWVPTQHDLHNQIQAVRCHEADENGLTGELVHVID